MSTALLSLYNLKKYMNMSTKEQLSFKGSVINDVLNDGYKEQPLCRYELYMPLWFKCMSRKEKITINKMIFTGQLIWKYFVNQMYWLHHMNTIETWCVNSFYWSVKWTWFYWRRYLAWKWMEREISYCLSSECFAYFHTFIVMW